MQHEHAGSARPAGRTIGHEVGVVTIDRMPRQATVAAQVLRALAERGLHIDTLAAGRAHAREQLVITVPADQAPAVFDVATNVAGRFGVGPVTLDASWTEITIEVRGERTAGVVMAELYELLEHHHIEARSVTANGSSVSCVVRDSSLHALLPLTDPAG